MSYDVRQIQAAEIGVLKQLLAVFGEAFGEPDTYGAHVPDDAYLRRLLGKPHFIALAALAGDEVVGGLAAYELEKFEQARSEITSTTSPCSRGTGARASRRLSSASCSGSRRRAART